MNELLRAIDYINKGGSPFVDVATFDDDFAPIGPKLRQELLEQKAITITAGMIKLEDKYVWNSLK